MCRQGLCVCRQCRYEPDQWKPVAGATKTDYRFQHTLVQFGNGNHFNPPRGFNSTNRNTRPSINENDKTKNDVHGRLRLRTHVFLILFLYFGIWHFMFSSVAFCCCSFRYVEAMAICSQRWNDMAEEYAARISMNHRIVSQSTSWKNSSFPQLHSVYAVCSQSTVGIRFDGMSMDGLILDYVCVRGRQKKNCWIILFFVFCTQNGIVIEALFVLSTCAEGYLLFVM